MSKAAEIIAKEISERGPITFARFVELALYCPVYGYYEKEADSVGCRGDYFTSVSVGGLFGELLALQFADWLASPEAGGGAVQIVEAGAHSGQLARDILQWLRQQRPGLFDRLEYWLIEPSPARQEWQRRTLGGLAPKVRWASSISNVLPGVGAQAAEPSPRLRGVIFSNEMLDALPAHRVGWDAGRMAWFERGVEMRSDRFVWTRLNHAGHTETCPGLSEEGLEAYGGLEFLPTSSRFESLAAILPDGFSTEVCPAAIEWWGKAAGAIDWGKLVTIDYGLAAEEFLAPERNEGTARAYRRHQSSTDVLADPGEQDVTAHVNFSAIRAAGEAAGLETESFSTQEEFLTKIAGKVWERAGAFDEWTAQHTRQFRTLTHPEHLGRAFRVLVQSRAPRAR